MPLYSFEGTVPRIARTAYVHPDAVVIGAVEIGPEASVWPAAVLRGDYGSIVIGARTSVQDGTVVHTTADWPTEIGADCVVGHGAHLEGCVIEERCLIASKSTVLNRVRIGAHSLVGAGAVVPPGTQAPPRSRLVGVPARIGPRTDEDSESWLDYAVRTYVQAARRYPTGQRAVNLEACLSDAAGGDPARSETGEDPAVVRDR